MSDNTQPKEIYQALAAVMQQVGYVQKEKSAKLSYTFAGEAALIAALRPALVDQGVVVHPQGYELIGQERFTTSKGADMQGVIVKAVFRFAHSASGTFIDVPAIGQANDSGDKAVNKAMTIALKYALRQALMIETGDDPDVTPSDEYERTTKTHSSTESDTAAKSNGSKAKANAADDSGLEKAKSFIIPAVLEGVELPSNLVGKTLGDAAKDKYIGKSVIAFLTGDHPNKDDKVFRPLGDDEEALAKAARLVLKSLKN